MKTVYIKAESIKKGDVLRSGFVASADARETMKGRVTVSGTLPRVRGVQHISMKSVQVVEKVVL